MGGVYKRLREETDFDTLELCDDLVRQTMKYVMNEKYVPKRWRFMCGEKLVNYADRIREYVTVANDIRATDEEKLEQRNTYQSRALSYCNLYQSKLIDMEEVIDSVTCENLRQITDTLDALIGHVVQWRKTDRVTT